MEMSIRYVVDAISVHTFYTFDSVCSGSLLHTCYKDLWHLHATEDNTDFIFHFQLDSTTK